MKKNTLISDPIFMNEIFKTFGNSHTWLVKSTTHYVRFENGSIFRFDKPSIKTEFCYGYGFCGVSTEEEENNAEARSESIKKKENFFNENMKYFRELERTINDIGENQKIYASNDYKNSSFVYLFNDNDVMWYNIYQNKVKDAYVLSKKDIQAMKNGIEIGKKMFIKRLETYWKRFGSSKIRSWTYLSD